MEVTEEGMETLVRLEQNSNAFSPMEVTEGGMVTVVRPSQFQNAFFPMEVTEYVLPSYSIVSGITRLPLIRSFTALTETVRSVSSVTVNLKSPISNVSAIAGRAKQRLANQQSR